MYLVHEGLLRRHVRESNLIEGIVARPGDPLHDGHLVAARLVAEGAPVHPDKLHRLLLHRVPGWRVWSGNYRTGGIMTVGKRKMPRAEAVPELMESCLSLIEDYRTLKSEYAEEGASFIHAWFLCVHPYRDGNGRTARLMLNALRLSKGLPWHVESAKNKHHYYAEIRRVEDLFREEYPDVYP